jgi:hypothetical protein
MVLIWIVFSLGRLRVRKIRFPMQACPRSIVKSQVRERWDLPSLGTLLPVRIDDAAAYNRDV